jgi:hypothetical protein
MSDVEFQMEMQRMHLLPSAADVRFICAAALCNYGMWPTPIGMWRISMKQHAGSLSVTPCLGIAQQPWQVRPQACR